MDEIRQSENEIEARARSAYRAMLGQQGPRDLPSEDQVVDLVLGRLNREDRERVADAVVASPELAGNVRDLMAIHAEAEPQLASTPVAGNWIWLAAAAAVIVVAIGVGPMLLRQGSVDPVDPGERVVRNGVVEAVFRTVPADGEILAVAPDRLSWSTVSTETPEGTAFRVVLYDFESSVLWDSGETSGSSTTIPDEVRGGMIPGKDYFWRVSRRSGLDEERSALLRFQIQP